ncbi:hypothetical protein BJ741DRAFT_654997 [Chytriomyces cf. hyalinus JEL632]|nr:hypothetical protein BJ741DRAFT_654997 [Chytriomyces cf. hyalinus JEL632]
MLVINNKMSSDKADLLLAKAVKTQHLPSPLTSIPSAPQEPRMPPPPPPPPTGPALPLPICCFTLESLNNSPESSKKACMELAPVIGVDGKATYLSFEIASWETVWAGLNAKTKVQVQVILKLVVMQSCWVYKENVMDAWPIITPSRTLSTYFDKHLMLKLH